VLRPHIIACKPSVMNLRYLVTQNVGTQVGPCVHAISAEHYFTGILHNNIKPACAHTHTHTKQAQRDTAHPYLHHTTSPPAPRPSKPRPTATSPGRSSSIAL